MDYEKAYKEALERAKERKELLSKEKEKVISTNGDVEYFNLKYKPAPGATSIEYDDEVFMGVEKIERID